MIMTTVKLSACRKLNNNSTPMHDLLGGLGGGAARVYIVMSTANRVIAESQVYLVTRFMYMYIDKCQMSIC